MNAVQVALPAKFDFRLYVAGDAANSTQALANLRAICAVNLPGRSSIEVVDVFGQPGRALADGVFMTPTLIKLSPAPVRRIVGSLNQREHVLEVLGVQVGVT